jgi:hypothetical protein
MKFFRGLEACNLVTVGTVKTNANVFVKSGDGSTQKLKEKYFNKNQCA